MLPVLVAEVLDKSGVPVSLDHDGVLVMFRTDRFNDIKDVFLSENLMQNLGEMSRFKEWSQYLLGEEVPIEAKRVIVAGQVKEFD